MENTSLKNADVEKAKMANAQWIKVDQYLPDEEISVLVFFNGEGMTIGCFSEDGWRILPNDGFFTGSFAKAGEEIEITHWMKLPAHPDAANVTPKSRPESQRRAVGKNPEMSCRQVT